MRQHKGKKRKISCTEVSNDLIAQFREKIDCLETSSTDATLKEKEDAYGTVSSNEEEGVGPSSDPKSKLDYVLQDMYDKTSSTIETHPLKVFHCEHCPVCEMMTLDLKQHMKTKREVKCENCKLFFSNCNTLRVHLDGRCKNAENNIKL